MSYNDNDIMLCIAHWERIRDGLDTDYSARSCALCRKFQRNGECHGCPVRERTGLDQCRGTPYVEFINFVIDYGACVNDGEFKRLAQAEIDFLRSLLPEK